MQLHARVALAARVAVAAAQPAALQPRRAIRTPATQRCQSSERLRHQRDACPDCANCASSFPRCRRSRAKCAPIATVASSNVHSAQKPHAVSKSTVDGSGKRVYVATSVPEAIRTCSCVCRSCTPHTPRRAPCSIGQGVHTAGVKRLQHRQHSRASCACLLNLSIVHMRNMV